MMRIRVVTFDDYTRRGDGNPASFTTFRNVSHILADRDLKHIIYCRDDWAEPEAGQEY
jgi:hypothetical protein